MRVVLDTNIIVSAFLWGGVPYRLLQMGIVGDIEIFTSPALIAELADVLDRNHFAQRIAAKEMSTMALLEQFQALAHIVLPLYVPEVIAADPDDDQVLACAVTAHADLIVSGDKHLLGLGGRYNGIPIVKAGEAVGMIEGGSCL